MQIIFFHPDILENNRELRELRKKLIVFHEAQTNLIDLCFKLFCVIRVICGYFSTHQGVVPFLFF